MKLVAAQDRAGAAERAIGEKPRAAVTKVQLAFGKTRGMAEQTRHGMNAAAGILQASTQHHVAAALPVHGASLREAPQAIGKVAGGRERWRMQLRITAG